MAPIIAITSQKGGVGKTTTAVNLGFALASEGKKTVIVDTDPQNSLAFSFGYDGDDVTGFFSVVDGSAALGEAVLDTTQARLKLVCAGANPGTVSERWVARRVKEQLTPLAQRADVVIVDTPSGMTGAVRETLAACDAVLAPVSCEPLAAMTLPRFVRDISAIRRLDGTQLPFLGFILNRMDSSSTSSTRVADELMSHLTERMLFDTVVPAMEKIPESVLAGQPLAVFEGRRSVATHTYAQLADELRLRLREFSTLELAE